MNVHYFVWNLNIYAAYVDVRLLIDRSEVSKLWMESLEHQLKLYNFAHLKLCLAASTHNFKRVNMHPFV